MATTINLTNHCMDVVLEYTTSKYGFVEFKETIESAMHRVADTFGFDYKKMHPLIDNYNYDECEDAHYVWSDNNGIWYEGYFKVGIIRYHFRYDLWDEFKPSLFTE